MDKLSEIDDNLLDAVDQGNLKLVKILLSKGAKMHTDRELRDPMQFADSAEMVELLLENGYPRNRYEEILAKRKEFDELHNSPEYLKELEEFKSGLEEFEREMGF